MKHSKKLELPTTLGDLRLVSPLFLPYDMAIRLITTPLPTGHVNGRWPCLNLALTA